MARSYEEIIEARAAQGKADAWALTVAREVRERASKDATSNGGAAAALATLAKILAVPRARKAKGEGKPKAVKSA